jgi:translocation and assembly module TamB
VDSHRWCGPVRRERGKIHVGALSGGFLTGLTIDSLEFREPNDSLFLATGPVRVTYDPRDIMDGVIYLRSLDVQRPFMRLQRRNNEWNYRSIFPAGAPRTGPRRGFGSRITVANVRIRGGNVRLGLPWSPPDSLRGARRDSAIAVALADTTGGVRRIGPNEYEKEWKWSRIAMQLAHAAVADPDTSGQRFEIARLDMVERYPPLNLRNVRGTVSRRSDSLWIDLSRFELPGSSGQASGKVVWGAAFPRATTCVFAATRSPCATWRGCGTACRVPAAGGWTCTSATSATCTSSTTWSRTWISAP